MDLAQCLHHVRAQNGSEFSSFYLLHINQILSHFLPQCFCCRVLSAFLKLPDSFPSHFLASVLTFHSPDSSYTVLLKSKTFWNNYMIFCWPLKNVQTTKPGLQGYSHLPQLPSFVGFSPGCRGFQVPLVSAQQAPCVFCTCCSFAGRNHYHEWSIINTLASVTNQLSQEGSCQTT